MPEVVGVFREPEFSPGRVEDDAAILARTADALDARGVSVRLGTADTLREGRPAAVLAMCQSDTSLAALDRHVPTIPVINSPTAIRNCHRVATVDRLGSGAVAFPETRIVPTRGSDRPTDVDTPCWIKRGDVHAMTAGDVTFAEDRQAVEATLDAFAARGIERAVLQRHVAGTVLKFYGVGADFFRCYADTDDPPTDIDTLWATARSGAAQLGLEVYGGDVVVTPEGRAVLIDVNDWPSFARCRDEAAEAISSHLCRRLGMTNEA